MPALETLHDLFVHELRDLYSAEAQLLKALPRLAKKAQNPELRAAFTEHVEVTAGQLERLDQIFADLGLKSKGKKCQAMEGLIEEAKELLAEKGDPAVMDAALIAAAQKVEHYEIAGYGCARTLARQLGLGDAETALQETLDEEGEADKRLTAIAEGMVHPQAEQEGEADGAEDEEEVEEQPKPRAAGGRRKGR